MDNLIPRSGSPLGISTFEELNNFVDSIWKGAGAPLTAYGQPLIDIYSEDDKHVVVEMQAPGFEKDDIEVHVRNGVLEIRGESHSHEESNSKKRSYMMRESHASFARRVVLPEGADANKISAELDKGVLKVTVPVERPEARKIQISSKSAPGKKKA